MAMAMTVLEGIAWDLAYGVYTSMMILKAVTKSNIS